MVTPALQLVRIRVTAGDRTLVEQADLTVARGERLALLGRNGAGKSTLLEVIVGARPADAGEVLVHGHPPPSRALGFVPQDCGASLLPWLNVRDNVILPLRLAGSERSGSQAALFAVRAMLDPDRRIDLGASPESLSGGERQLVAWMRALVTRPALLVCDEPFAAVDLEVRARLDAALETLASGSAPPALIFTTHDPRDLTRHADRALVLDGGALVRWIGTGPITRAGAA